MSELWTYSDTYNFPFCVVDKGDIADTGREALTDLPLGLTPVSGSNVQQHS